MAQLEKIEKFNNALIQSETDIAVFHIEEPSKVIGITEQFGSDGLLDLTKSQYHSDINIAAIEKKAPSIVVINSVDINDFISDVHASPLLSKKVISLFNSELEYQSSVGNAESFVQDDIIDNSSNDIDSRYGELDIANEVSEINSIADSYYNNSEKVITANALPSSPDSLEQQKEEFEIDDGPDANFSLQADLPGVKPAPIGIIDQKIREIGKTHMPDKVDDKGEMLPDFQAATAMLLEKESNSNSESGELLETEEKEIVEEAQLDEENSAQETEYDSPISTSNGAQSSPSLLGLAAAVTVATAAAAKKIIPFDNALSVEDTRTNQARRLLGEAEQLTQDATSSLAFIYQYNEGHIQETIDAIKQGLNANNLDALTIAEEARRTLNNEFESKEQLSKALTSVEENYQAAATKILQASEVNKRLKREDITNQIIDAGQRLSDVDDKFLSLYDPENDKKKLEAMQEMSQRLSDTWAAIKKALHDMIRSTEKTNQQTLSPRMS